MYLTSKPDQPVATRQQHTPRPISPEKPPEEQQRVPYPTPLVQDGKEGVVVRSEPGDHDVRAEVHRGGQPTPPAPVHHTRKITPGGCPRLTTSLEDRKPKR